MSTILLALVTLASSLQAHEVLPSVADMRVTDDRLRFDVSANLEGFVAGIDLSAMGDIDNSPRAAAYDRLRALPPAVLEERFRAFWPQMAAGLTITADGTMLTPVLEEVRIAPVGNVDIARTSTFVFSAPLPAGAETARFQWDPSFGVLVLRQMDVPSPYDGYLVGGAASDVIALGGASEATIGERLVRFGQIGFAQVVPGGPDHILFLLAIMLVACSPRPLAAQLGLFFAGGAVAFVLGTAGPVSLRTGVIETLIAASIVVVALDNLRGSTNGGMRLGLVAISGLLHGSGFAADLDAVRLAEGSGLVALGGYALGVTAALLSVVAAAWLCLWQVLRIDRGKNEAGRGYAIYLFLGVSAAALGVLDPDAIAAVIARPVWIVGAPVAAFCALSMLAIGMRGQVDAYHRIVAVPASLAIALVGALWCIERAFG